MLTAAIIEIRRGLRCANIFLKFDVQISQWQDSVKVKVQTDKFTFLDPHNLICIDFIDFKVEPDSLCNFLISENNISFRLSLIKDEEQILDDSVDPNDKETVTYNNNVEINIKPYSLCEILCKCCKNVIIKEREFKRVLELPSGTIDLSNFFCHNGPDLEQMIIPKENDIFYGLYCIVLNSQILYNVINKNELCYCQICQQYLGELIYNSKAVNFWNENISLKKCNDDIRNIFLVNELKQISYNILNGAFNEYNSIKNINSFQFSKILIDAIFPNGIKHYLMINILEKNLYILKYCKIMKKFEKRKCNKILFKIENVTNKALLIFWLKDIYIHRITISYQIFKCIADYLTKYSEVIPSAYRKHDCFLSSYFFYKK